MIISPMIGVREREAELDVQHPRLAADPKAQRLVEAALDVRDLAVDPTEDLDGAALGDERAHQVFGVPSGEVAQRDVGISHARRHGRSRTRDSGG
ncbi:hypothetical protein WMF26_29435 [Sorangium sp. So ce185]|uniref:hypothetical protein n=1 Tax=Sorangium sp. So ce185 TaxID=3133287 RepID=UPI003F5E28FC